MHKISKAIVAPTSEVILFTSKGGETSTTSAPIKLISFNARIISCDSLTLKPPTSGVLFQEQMLGQYHQYQKLNKF